MWFFKIFFQISIYSIELWLIFCKFRSYERSELQVHRTGNIQFQGYQKTDSECLLKFIYLTIYKQDLLFIHSFMYFSITVA